jgi:ribonuclease BN (tRNA processing enzyme)
MVMTTRRQLIAGGAAFGLGLGMNLMGSSALMAQQARRSKLVLLGTQGGPNIRLQRAETSNALVVDDVVYLIDCGYGALRNLHAADLQYRDVSTVVLTHLHDDHISDLPAFLTHQWTGGRIDRTEVYGPYGTADMIKAAVQFMKPNTEIRLVDEARTVRPENMFFGHDIEAEASAVTVLKDERVTITAIENTHFPPESKAHMPYRSVSYRFDTPDRSFVFSGDTAYSENLVNLAKGADILVCEAMEKAVTRKNFERRVAAGEYKDNPEGIWHHVQGTHSELEVVGRMASEAGVKTVVLNHLVPGALIEIPDSDYIDGVRKTFDGEVILGRDLMVL